MPTDPLLLRRFFPKELHDLQNPEGPGISIPGHFIDRTADNDWLFQQDFNCLGDGHGVT